MGSTILTIVTLCAVLLGFPALGASATYRGDSVCKTCHASITPQVLEHFGNTAHQNSIRDIVNPGNPIYRDPTDPKWGVLGDFNPPGGFITLSKASKGIPLVRIYLRDDSGTKKGPFWVTLGSETGPTYRVDRLHGGGIGWKQRHQTQIGNSYYILPIQWNEPDSKWVEFGLEDWFNTDGTAKEPARSQSFERRCIGCHATGVDVAYNAETGEYVAAPIGGGHLNIGCEACHGPGSDHVSGQGDKTKIVNPARLSRERRIEVCGRCHNRGDSTAVIGGNRFGFPYKEGVGLYQPGQVLGEYFTITANASDYWGYNPADGSYIAPKGHRQQYIDQINGHHGTPISPGCNTCHSAHGSPSKRMLKQAIGRFAGLKVEDNSLCLACHTDRFAREVDITSHTRHPYDPKNLSGTGGASRCVFCHMPTTAKTAINYDEHAHLFGVLRPQLTLDWKDKGGMINSCAVGCHRKKAIDAGPPAPGYNDTSLTNWAEPADLDLATDLLNKSEGWFELPNKRSHAFVVGQGSFAIQWAKKDQGKPNEDSLSLSGFFNPGELGVSSLDGVRFTLFLGGYQLGPFSLTATGYQSPAGALPTVSIKLDTRKHTFSITLKKADLGGIAENLRNLPSGPVPIRVVLTFGEVVFMENLSWAYLSSASSGKGSYKFAKMGDEPDGVFHVTSAKFSPGKTADGRDGKALTLVAQIAAWANGAIDPQGNGLRVAFANYEETVGGNNFKANPARTVFTYARPANQGKTNIKSVKLDLAKGAITIVTYPLPDLVFPEGSDLIMLFEAESADWAGVSRLVLPASGSGWQY